eukprot:763032-Hanusia_phi.AAC.1
MPEGARSCLFGDACRAREQGSSSALRQCNTCHLYFHPLCARHTQSSDNNNECGCERNPAASASDTVVQQGNDVQNETPAGPETTLSSFQGVPRPISDVSELFQPESSA